MELGRFLEYHYKGNVTIWTDRGILCSGSTSYVYSMLHEFDIDSEIKGLEYKVVKTIRNDVITAFETLQITI